MGRRIVAGAALAALMVGLSACVCHGGISGAKPGPAPGTAAKKPCHPYVDCSGCYKSEANSDVHRLRDNLPPGGSCKHCDGASMGGGDGHECKPGCSCPKCAGH